MKTKIEATLAILCGGESLRLGTDKGLFQAHGEALVARQLRLFRDHFQEILIVVKDSEQKRLYASVLPQAKIVTDADYSPEFSSIFSTLTGIHTAVRAASFTKVAVVCVDQVALRPLHLQKLLATSAAAFQSGWGEEIFPLPSVWNKSEQEWLASRLEAKALSVKSCLYDQGSTFLAAEDFVDELRINANSAQEIKNYFGRSLYDKFARKLHYLRFSLIESCNMACQYCLPKGFPEWYRHKARLDLEDIETVLLGFRELGFQKVRFTGGEPTLHPSCLESVRKARKIGFEQISLTTNGLLIQDLQAWQDAGLTQLNVSLDSLRADVFKDITQSDKLGTVLDLIERAQEIGLPVKINTVLLRSKNGTPEETQELIHWALERDVSLRFIELMPTKLNASFHRTEHVSGNEIKPLLQRLGLSQENSLNDSPGNIQGPATYYSSPQFRGKIGLINPLSCNFCDKCNRLRVTAKAGLRLCLFGDDDLALNLESPTLLAAQVRSLIEHKKDKHHLEKGELGNVFTFRTIGG